MKKAIYISLFMITAFFTFSCGSKENTVNNSANDSLSVDTTAPAKIMVDTANVASDPSQIKKIDSLPTTYPQ